MGGVRCGRPVVAPIREDDVEPAPRRCRANGRHAALARAPSAGADVDSVDAKGWARSTPRRAAGVELAMLLLDMRAAFDVPCREDGMRPLHYAARSGSMPIVNALLERRADVLVADASGCTPAWLSSKHAEVHEVLVDAMRTRVHADGTISYPDPSLCLAAAKGDASTVRQLLNDRADPNSICSGATALQHACASHRGLVDLATCAFASCVSSKRARR